MRNHLFALTALFDTPDEIIHAAEEVAGAGYTRFDVNTPYPVHGMDKAMRLQQSRLGRLRLRVRVARDASPLVVVHDMDDDLRLSVGNRRQAILDMAGIRAHRVRDHCLAGIAVLTVVTMIVLYLQISEQ